MTVELEDMMKEIGKPAIQPQTLVDENGRNRRKTRRKRRRKRKRRKERRRTRSGCSEVATAEIINYIWLHKIN